MLSLANIDLLVQYKITLTAIFINIFTVHARKWLFANFWYKFWQHHSISPPQFSYSVWHCGDLWTFSIDFCISNAESLPYFYFGLLDLLTHNHRPRRPTTISTKFGVNMTFHCQVSVFVADVKWLDFLTFDISIHGGSHELWTLNCQLPFNCPMIQDFQYSNIAAARRQKLA